MTTKRTIAIHVMAIWAGALATGGQVSRLQNAIGGDPTLPISCASAVISGIAVMLTIISLIAWAPGAGLDPFCKVGVVLHLIGMVAAALAFMSTRLALIPAADETLEAVKSVMLLVAAMTLLPSIVLFVASNDGRLDHRTTAHH